MVVFLQILTAVNFLVMSHPIDYMSHSDALSDYGCHVNFVMFSQV